MIDLIVDPDIRGLLSLGRKALAVTNYADSARLNLWALQAAIASIFDLDDEIIGDVVTTNQILYGADLEGFLVAHGMSDDNVSMLGSGLRELSRRVTMAQNMAALLSQGVQLSDYKHYKQILDTPEEQCSEGDARWLHDFASRTISNWQTAGLNPTMPESMIKDIRSLLEDSNRRITTGKPRKQRRSVYKK